MVPRAVLMKYDLVSVNTARQVNAAHSKTIVNAARPKSHFSKTAYSIVKRPSHKNTTFKNSNFNQRVNTVKDKNVNTVRPKAVANDARPKAVVNVVKGNNVNAVKASASWGNPQMDLQEKGVIDSRCSRHMTENMSYLTDYKEIDGGYVAFGGNPKGGKITGKGYYTQSKAYRVFNKRTRIIVETIHVNFDELPQMASDHVSSNPVPQSETVTTSNELDFLFSLMFDELLNGTTPVVSKSSAVHAADAPDKCQHQNITHSSTTTVVAAEPPLNIHTTPQTTNQAPTQVPTVTAPENIIQSETNTEYVQVDNDEFINIFSTPVQE
ncbi:hypothetical protein Tco_1162540 [Tanacetum coccineum]